MKQKLINLQNITRWQLKTLNNIPLIRLVA